MSDSAPSTYVRDEIRLPNEILAIITNELASDHTTLAKLRLVSLVFSSLATPLFFSFIEWTQSVRTLQERAANLNRLLAIPDIAALVHGLTLRCWSDSRDSRNGTLIAEVIHRLSHIRNFTLERIGGSLNFSRIAGEFSSAFELTCRSPNLRTLNLGNIYLFPITVITSCPNLRRLRLWCVKFYVNEMSSLQPLYLDFLEIDDFTVSSLVTIGPSGHRSFAKYFSQIKHLRLKNLFVNLLNLMYGWDFMLAASQSLTILDLPSHNNLYPLDSNPQYIFKTVPFDLGRFPALRCVKIQLRMSFQHNAAILCYLNQIFSSTGGIETIEIKITWDDIKYGCGKDLFSPDVGWSTLDEALACEKLISLRRVVLNLGLEMKSWVVIDAEYDLEAERKMTLPYIDALFPMLRALKNTLEVHVEFTAFY